MLKIDSTLILTGLVALIALLGFLFLYRVCTKLKTKQEELENKQMENLQPSHFPLLVEASKPVRDLAAQHADLSDQCADLRAQMQIFIAKQKEVQEQRERDLFYSQSTIRPFSTTSKIDVEGNDWLNDDPPQLQPQQVQPPQSQSISANPSFTLPSALHIDDQERLYVEKLRQKKQKQRK
jgi:hypothetical protein